MADADLQIDILNGVNRYRCPDCGRWEYAGKSIKHSKRCDLNAQPTAIEVLIAKRKEEAEGRRLWAFAQRVKRTSMGQGRTEDLLECVRRGYLTESEAMNLDD